MCVPIAQEFENDSKRLGLLISEHKKTDYLKTFLNSAEGQCAMIKTLI